MLFCLFVDETTPKRELLATCYVCVCVFLIFTCCMGSMLTPHTHTESQALQRKASNPVGNQQTFARLLPWLLFVSWGHLALQGFQVVGLVALSRKVWCTATSQATNSSSHWDSSTKLYLDGNLNRLRNLALVKMFFFWSLRFLCIL